MRLFALSRMALLAIAAMAFFACAPAQAASGNTAAHATAANTGSLTGRVILLDPGHGGKDPGTEQPWANCGLTQPTGADAKIHEKTITLAIAFKLKAELEARGATVYMTRETDVFVDLWDRVAMSADISKTPQGQRDGVASRQTDIFTSIHVNSVDYSTTFDEIGIYSYFQPGKDLSAKIAPVLQQEMAKNTRMIHPMDFRVIDHNPTIPSILIETGFMTKASTCRDLITDPYQQQFAHAIADGMDNYFNNTGVGGGQSIHVTDPTKLTVIDNHVIGQHAKKHRRPTH